MELRAWCTVNTSNSNSNITFDLLAVGMNLCYLHASHKLVQGLLTLIHRDGRSGRLSNQPRVTQPVRRWRPGLNSERSASYKLCPKRSWYLSSARDSIVNGLLSPSPRRFVLWRQVHYVNAFGISWRQSFGVRLLAPTEQVEKEEQGAGCFAPRGLLVPPRFSGEARV